MIKKLFNNKKRKEQEFLAVLQREFNDFLAENRERVVLGRTPLSKEAVDEYRYIVQGGWIHNNQGRHQYYPYEVLDRKERLLVDNHIQYQTLSFIMPNAFGVALYQRPGIEIISRIHPKKKRPELDKTSLLRYHNIVNFFPEKDFSLFAENSVQAEYDIDKFVCDVIKGYSEYDALTDELIIKEKYKRDKVLEQYEKRDAPADAFLFNDLAKKLR